MRNDDLALSANLQHAVQLVDEVDSFFSLQMLDEVRAMGFFYRVVLPRPLVSQVCCNVLPEVAAVNTFESLSGVLTAAEVQL
jgi:hypothetical protein